MVKHLDLSLYEHLPLKEYSELPEGNLRGELLRELRIPVYPTKKLISFLSKVIQYYDKPIEVFSGRGQIGTKLGIPITDRKLYMNDPAEGVAYMSRYLSLPNSHYHADCEELTWSEAISKYSPDLVISAWPGKDGFAHKDIFVEDRLMSVDTLLILNEGFHNVFKTYLGRDGQKPHLYHIRNMVYDSVPSGKPFVACYGKELKAVVKSILNPKK